MWWTCRVVKQYWEMIHNELKNIFKTGIPKKPKAFLLGITGPDVTIKEMNLFLYETTTARMLYVQRWCENAVPAKEEEHMKLMEYAELANLTNKIREEEETIFKEDWKPFVDYLKNYCKSVKTLVSLERAQHFKIVWK